MKVLVTGATGNVGAHVVRALRERGVAVRAFVRDGDRAAHMLGEDVELAVGDFADRAALERALDGAERLFLACGNVPAQVEHECAAIDAAAAAGIERVVKLSGPAPAVDSPLLFDRWHGEIEAHLQRSGLAWVLLRPSAFMSNLLAYADTINETGRLYAPAAIAKIAYIDPRDVAEAAAVALTTDGHDGQSYALTGPQAITYGVIAHDLSLALGRPVEYLHVPDHVAHRSMCDAGLPPAVADAIVALFRAQRAGMMACTTHAVHALTGRCPRPFSQFARDHAALFGARALARS